MPDQQPENPQVENDPVPPGTGPLSPGNATGGGGPSGNNATGGRGPGAGEAGIIGIAILALYLIVFTLIVIYSLVKIWPVPTPSREEPPSATATPTPNAAATVTPTATPTATPVAGANPTTSPRPGSVSPSPTRTPTPTPTPSPTPGQPSKVTMLGWQFDLWDEQRLLLLVILGGALGTLVHTMRSVYWYIGNRNLIKSWMAMYFMLPFAGAALALVFYLVVRGGFFSPQSSFQQTSPFGFAAFAALIGMFSSQAVLKLKEVAEVLLSKPGIGANAKPQEITNPATAASPTQPSKPPAGGNLPGQH